MSLENAVRAQHERLLNAKKARQAAADRMDDNILLIEIDVDREISKMYRYLEERGQHDEVARLKALFPEEERI